jgi:hypothetical protein
LQEHHKGADYSPMSKDLSAGRRVSICRSPFAAERNSATIDGRSINRKVASHEKYYSRKRDLLRTSRLIGRSGSTPAMVRPIADWPKFGRSFATTPRCALQS